MTLVIGTKNQAKVNQIKSILAALGLDIQGLPDQKFPEIPETGQTALENAKQKAISYAAIIGQAVLSTDNALYLDGLAPDKQPGLNVRHIKGRSDRPEDTEILEYYSELIKELGGEITGYWEYGVCLAQPDGRSEETIIRGPRLFVSRASQKVIAGYPLESLQINPENGRYISEMSEEEKADFWQRTIGRDLCDFIKKSQLLN